MIVSGLLSLAGLIGVPLANMNVRNIGYWATLGSLWLCFYCWG